MKLQSRKAHVVYRGPREHAERFLTTMRPALLAFTQHTGIVCREERGDGSDPLYDVRAMCERAVAEAVHELLLELGAEAGQLTEAMVLARLKEREK